MKTLLAVTIMAALLLVGAASAAKVAPATLAFSPDPAAAWSSATGSGCGYVVGVEVYIDVQKSNALAFTSTMPDAGGCVSFVISTDEPGVYEIQARQRLQNKRWTVMARAELAVE